MNTLPHKIDFALIFQVTNANPNGDPLNGNRPRIGFDNRGEITDVCMKRKIRDRLVERFESLRDAGADTRGQAVYVQSSDRCIDGHASLRSRAETVIDSRFSRDQAIDVACSTWFDVRAFGQLFAFSKKAKKSQKPKAADSVPNDDATGNEDGVSIGIRGPVTVQMAVSVEPIEVTSTQITKSVSAEGDGSVRGSDTMGMKHRVDGRAVYVAFGSMNPQLARRTGFSAEDAEVLKQLLPRLFENDASSARPDGSMQVLKLVWCEHDCAAGRYSAARVHGSIVAQADGSVRIQPLTGLSYEEIDGF